MVESMFVLGAETIQVLTGPIAASPVSRLALVLVSSSRCYRKVFVGFFFCFRLWLTGDHEVRSECGTRFDDSSDFCCFLWVLEPAGLLGSYLEFVDSLIALVLFISIYFHPFISIDLVFFHGLLGFLVHTLWDWMVFDELLFSQIGTCWFFILVLVPNLLAHEINELDFS